MYKRKSSDKQIDEVIYKAEHDGFGLNEEELDAYMANYPFGNGANPIGTIIAFMGNTPPIGYLACDGSEYDIVDYPKLAKFFKDQFGSTQYFGGTGDKFKVPDLRGEFLRGTGTNGHANEGSGEAVGVHQNATQHLFKRNATGSQVTPYNVGGTGTYSDFDGPNVQHGSYGHWVNKNYGIDKKYYTSRPTNTSVLYCIKADTVTIEELNDTYLLGYDKYSTDEQVVGCWTDGKPLYQKTVEVTAPTVSSNGTFAYIDITLSSLNINNVDHIFIEDSHLIYTDTNGTYSYQLTYITNGNFQIKTLIHGNSGNRVIRTISSFSDYSGHKVYVTLRYTKTTDPVNSFSITQLSNFKKVTNEANNYSLEEKVIGTWISGKPIYQKTIDFGALPTADSRKSVSTGLLASSIDRIIHIDGFSYTPNDTRNISRTFPYSYVTKTSAIHVAWWTQVSDNYININCMTNYNMSNESAYVTLKYTKTTD